MSGIVIVGAGACGLTAAMLLAKDGHDVTVLERDEMPAPASGDAWDTWERTGVNQFRLPHFLMPRWRYEMARELPDVVEAFENAGAYGFNFFGPFRDFIPEPDRFDVLTARRPVLDAVLAAAAATTPGVDVRRGVAIDGLVTGPPLRDSIPHVVGIRTSTGEVIRADLVIAATGRRSPLARWLDAIGARMPIEEKEDSGFVYYGRYVRSRDGGPVVDSPDISDHGSIGLLSLPADDGTCGVGIIAASSDAAMRGLRHEEPWQRVLRLLPKGEALLDTTPISPLVAMAGIEDVIRRFVVDGVPVATGVIAVADAWAATNPTLGRGISLGLLHVLALRDAIRAHGEDPFELAVAFDDITERTFTPWYRSTVWHDRHKLAAYAAAAKGEPEDCSDERWNQFTRLASLMGTDLEMSAVIANTTTFLARTPEEMLADPDVQAKIPEPLDRPPAAPARAELLGLVASS